MEGSPNPDPPEDFTVLTKNTVDSEGRDAQIASYADPDRIQMVAVGPMDLYTASAFKSLLLGQMAAYPKASNVEIDLTQSTFIDSTFVAVLVGSIKRPRGRIIDRSELNYKVIIADRNIAKIFELMGLDRAFQIEKLFEPK